MPALTGLYRTRTLGHGRRDARVGVEVVDDRPYDVPVRFLALVCFEAVGREVPAVPHVDSLLSSLSLSLVVLRLLGYFFREGHVAEPLFEGGKKAYQHSTKKLFNDPNPPC